MCCLRRLKGTSKAGVCQAKCLIYYFSLAEKLLRTGVSSVWGAEGLTILQADFNTAAKR